MGELKRQWGRNVRIGRAAIPSPSGAGRLTQSDLARLCGVTQQTISSIERGEYAPRDDLKIAIAVALHQDVHQLFPLSRPVALRH